MSSSPFLSTLHSLTSTDPLITNSLPSCVFSRTLKAARWRRRAVCDIISHRTCFIVRAVRTAASEWLTYKTSIQPTHFIRSFQGGELIQTYSSELFLPSMMRTRAGSEPNCLMLAASTRIKPTRSGGKLHCPWERFGFNLIRIHLKDENLSCKCSGSIFRLYAPTLELNDIY